MLTHYPDIYPNIPLPDGVVLLFRTRRVIGDLQVVQQGTAATVVTHVVTPSISAKHLCLVIWLCVCFVVCLVVYSKFSRFIVWSFHPVVWTFAWSFVWLFVQQS